MASKFIKSLFLVAFIAATGLACTEQGEPAAPSAAPAAPGQAAKPTPAQPTQQPQVVAPPAGSPSPGPAGAVTITLEARAEADQLFTGRCAICHGATGAGDGPGAAALNPKPRNYSDAEWQKAVTDEQIEKAIVGGGPAIGKSPLMPPNPDLSGKPIVVAALREKIRSFAKK